VLRNFVFSRVVREHPGAERPHPAMADAKLAAMSTRSMFGDQPNSLKGSAPAYGFGTSTRQHASKIFVSNEHARLASTGAPPAPNAYSLNGAVASQHDSRKTSMPQWAFGSAERFTYEKKSAANPGPGAYQSHQSCGSQVSSAKQTEPIFGFGTSERHHVANIFISEEHNKSRHGLTSPGPAVYTLKGAFNKQEVSKQKTAPTWVFGTGQRFKYDFVKRGATSPGPGAYTLSMSVGAQPSSMKQSAANFSFGSGTRDHQAKLYVSQEHEKINAGVHSPGPSSYTLQEANGKQNLSKNVSASAWGFGTASRWASADKGKSSLQTPGPGAYAI